ncbi:MAG: metallophosphoesterase family protein [Pleurocapsa sp.]
MTSNATTPTIQTTNNSFLSDPFLQLPTENSVRVVWFTDFFGDTHEVVYGHNLEQKVIANTKKLSRVREDTQSELDQTFTELTWRDIWRHEAIVQDLTANHRLPYQVKSTKNGNTIVSDIFTLTSQPKSGTPLKILLTSDHQLMPMTAANLQKVVETVDKIDGVFFAGDLVNIPDRASEWFDDGRGGAFFPCLQGKANYQLAKNDISTVYRGGEIIQHAPLFPAIGNHEIMGRFSDEKLLKEQFNDAIPLSAAKQHYREIQDRVNPDRNSLMETTWLKNNSFNSDTYEEIFSLPNGQKYYAVTFGDIRLIVLYVTNIWRTPDLDADVPGRYQEKIADLDSPQKWGYGQHIFEAIAQGSPQYNWLERELQSEAFKQAKYKIVMFHHPPHTLGGNIVPPYTDPQPVMEYGEDGTWRSRSASPWVRSRHYQYPITEDYIIRDLIPLLEASGVQLVYYGHSHLWNRFVSDTGMHFLESSNVGNSYGAHLGDNLRPIPPTEFARHNYAVLGDPNGLNPVTPNIAPLTDELGKPLPYIASNDITVFSIFDTATGTISSYRYDTSKPDSPVVKFDEFQLSK